MTGNHHLIAGGVVGACTATSIILSGESNFLMAGGALATAMIGSIFPDIDSRTSKMGKKLKLTSIIVSKLFGHRGFFHSPIFVIGLAFLLQFLFGHFGIVHCHYLWNGFIIGVIAHLVCDMTTKGGIPLLYPFSRGKFSVTWMKSGSKYEIIPLFIICAAAIALTVLFCMNGTYL